MTDRIKYAEVRQKIIEAIRTDLIGPREDKEVLEENPRYAYLVGMLDVQNDDEDYCGAGEQEVDTDMAFEDGEDFTAGEDDDNEPISTTHFQHRLDRMIPQVAKVEGVNEALKASDPMMWVGRMNSIHHRTEETILAELIYA